MSDDPGRPLDGANDASERRLDQMLREARWPEPEPQRIEGLLRRWSRLSPNRPLMKWQPVAIAAGLLLALGTAAWLSFDGTGADRLLTRSTPAITEQPAPKAAPDVAGDPSKLSTSQPVATSEQRQAPLVESRPATVYEQVVLLAASRRRPAAKPLPPKREEPSLVKQVLEQVAGDTGADLDRLAVPLLARREVHERELHGMIGNTTGATRQAAIRLLGPIGSERSVSLLYALLGPSESHRAAVAALARLVDSARVARLAAAEGDRKLQRVLLAALIQRGGRDAVRLFLGFVEDRRTTYAALDALDEAGGVPADAVELFFEHLGSSQNSLRLAAARVLGRLDGPAISARLARMVLHNVSQREAVLALLWIPGGEASEFLAQAERDPYLRAVIGAARSQLQWLN